LQERQGIWLYGCEPSPARAIKDSMNSRPGMPGQRKTDFQIQLEKLQRLMMDLNPLASSCCRALDADWLSEYGPT